MISLQHNQNFGDLKPPEGKIGLVCERAAFHNREAVRAGQARYT